MHEPQPTPPVPQPATWSADPDLASALLQATAAGIIARGHEPLWPPDTLTRGALAQDYPEDGWQVLLLGERPAGCFVLMDPDPVFWAEKPPGEALYLHKLAVHPDFQGQGLNRVLLSRAETLTRQAGRRWLRLDTDVSRPGLQAIYRGFGFATVDRQHVMGFEVFRYQKEV